MLIMHWTLDTDGRATLTWQRVPGQQATPGAAQRVALQAVEARPISLPSRSHRGAHALNFREAVLRRTRNAA